MPVLSGCSQSCSWEHEEKRALVNFACYLVLIFFLIVHIFFFPQTISGPDLAHDLRASLSHIYIIGPGTQMKHSSSHLLLKLFILFSRSLLKKNKKCQGQRREKGICGEGKVLGPRETCRIKTLSSTVR